MMGGIDEWMGSLAMESNSLGDGGRDLLLFNALVAARSTTGDFNRDWQEDRKVLIMKSKDRQLIWQRSCCYNRLYTDCPTRNISIKDTCFLLVPIG